MDQARYYKHSGAFSPGGVLTALAAGCAAGIPLGFVYAYALVYIPVVGWFTFILSGLFGLGTGFVSGKLLRKSDTRNGAVTFATGLAATGVAWYASWVAWTFALLQRSDVDVPLAMLVTQPARLWGIVGVINGKGAWSVKGMTPTGAALWAFWALEALIILGAGAFAAWTQSSQPFCEQCGAWTEKRIGSARLALAEPRQVKQLADTDQILQVASFGKAAPDARSWLRLDLHTCPRCQHFHVLDVQQVSLKVEKGRTTDSTRAIVSGLLVSPETARQAADLEQRFAAAA